MMNKPTGGSIEGAGLRSAPASRAALGVFEDVYTFQVAMGLPMPMRPQLIDDPKLENFRQRFLEEELSEYVLAVKRGDLVKAVDALHDLIYVASGTLAFMGLSPYLSNVIWRTIHEKNMQKRRATSDRDSMESTGRGSGDYDVVKPTGWTSPEPLIHELLRSAGAHQVGEDEENGD